MPETDRKPEGRPVPLKWVTPSDLQALYANQMTVQHTEHEFFITFYQAKPPLGLSSEEIMAIEEIEARAVAQIVIPASAMPGFVRAWQDNLERHDKALGYEGEEES